MRAVLHAITPGDHFSPLTGSAIPTVVDSMVRAAADLGETRAQRVLVADATYPERYTSAETLGYRLRREPGPVRRAADLLVGRLGGVRPFQRHHLGAMVAGQREWSPSFVVAHNLIQLMPLVDGVRHRPVLYAHNDLLRTYSPREAARALDGVALIVCVSEFLAERTRQRLPGTLRERVVVVPNAADCGQFSPRDDPGTGALRVAFLGRVIPDKGADVLLRAAALLSDLDLEISVVGSAGFDGRAELTPFERELRQLSEGLSHRVTFRPFTDRLALPGLLRSHDVLAVPSRWPEPWGLTVSEGQAAGLVVIAGDTGGIPEAISDPSHLVPPGDPEALAAQLRRFASDRPLLDEHRRAARAHAEAHDWHTSWRILARHLDAVR